MMRPDNGAINHLNAVRHCLAVVLNLKDRLPEPSERPTPELAIDRAPFAEFFRQVPPRSTRARNPVNAIQNEPVIDRLTPVWLPDRLYKWLEESPFRIRHQISRQDSLPSKSYLESR